MESTIQKIQCIHLNPTNEQILNGQSILQIRKISKSIRLNNKQMNYKIPIGLQQVGQRCHIYLNPLTEVIISSQNIDKLRQAFVQSELGHVMVPSKQVQCLAQQYNNQRKQCLIHCGSFIFQHNYFFVLNKIQKVAQIRDTFGKSIKIDIKQLSFNDNKQAVTFQKDSIFYFWKECAYIEVKFIILDLMNQLKYKGTRQNKNIIPNQHGSQMDEQNQKINNQDNIENSMDQEAPQQQIKYQQGKNHVHKTQKKVKQTKYEREWKTIPKMKLNQKQQLQDQQQKVENNKQHKIAQKVSHSLESVENVRCQYKFDTLQFKHDQKDSLLVYNSFSDRSDIQYQIGKGSQIIYRPKHIESRKNNTQQSNIIPTKIISDVENQSAYYNNLNLGFLYCFNLQKQFQISWDTESPVLDFCRNSLNTLLCIHRNQIFTFDARASQKQSVVLYKTVDNLTKISTHIFQNEYATASDDGSIRTYDVRNNMKALNKFDMQPGITSLQISKNNNFILCGYGRKGKIINCHDQLNQSVFESKTKICNRKKATNIVQGYENLSHVQFVSENTGQEDIVMAINDEQDTVVIKNIQSNTVSMIKKLRYKDWDFEKDQPIEYLNSYRDYLIYANKTSYYRFKM